MSIAGATTKRKSGINRDIWQSSFGLNADPFTVDLKPFFGGGQRQENLDALRHLVHFSNRILLVTGDKGSGKTFLLDRLCGFEKTALKLVRIKPKLLQGSASLLQQMASQTDLSCSPKSSLEEIVEKIKESCEKRFSNGFKTLFIIDDAHDLSDDSLELLVARFWQETPTVYGLLLLAQPQIVDQIRRLFPTNEKQPFHQIQLKNFTQNESVSYAELYLLNAGWDKSVAFPPKVASKLHEVGRGVPGRINRIAASVLISGGGIKRRGRGSSLTMMLAGGGGALVLAFAIIGYQYSVTGGKNSQKDPTTKHTISLEIPDEQIFLSEDKVSEEILLSEFDSVVTDPSPPHRYSNSDTGEKGIEAELDQTAISGDPDDSSVGETTLSVTDQAEGEAGSVTDRTVQEAADIKSSSQAQKPDSYSASVDSEAPHQKELPQSEELRVSASEPAEAPEFFRSQAWLDAQANKSWTIQILGSLYEETAIKFLKKNRFDKDYFYVKSSYQSKDWYVVLQGVYPTKEAARSGLSKLPEKQQESGAWIRSIAGLQSR